MHLAATFDIITPVFCAGAEQNGGASIRPMSIRGCLRYWYRAIDEQFRENEPRIFGAAAAGQGSRASPMVLSVVEPCRGNRDFSGELQARGEDSRGAAYLGYALYLGENRRKGIEPGRQFVLHVRERWTGEGDLVRRAWIASIWLLGHLGGIGARSRRALGTCALRQWNSPEGWPEPPAPAHGAATVDDWLARFRRGLERLRRWFPPAGLAGHQHQMLGPNPEIFLFREGARSWDEAMDRAGDTLRSVRHDLLAIGGGVHLWLASLGMPRKFRNPPEMATLEAVDRSASRLPIDRSASRVHIRIVRIGQAFHPLFVLMDAPVVPPRTPVVFKDITNKKQERRRAMPDPTDAALYALRNRLNAAALAM